MSEATTETQTGGLGKGPMIAAWVAQAIVVGVFLMLGPIPKLTSDPISVALFEKIGPGDPLRYATGVFEAIAIVLILIPKTAWAGAALSAGLMVGAIGAHLVTPLGVSVSLEVEGGDIGPVPFALAVLTLLASLAVLAIRRKQIPVIGDKL
ncbi:MAG: DoxX family protein [Planctomycetota bacterium]